MDCWGGRGDAWQRAQRLHDKMKTNLGMAKDRLHFLGMRLYSITETPESLPHLSKLKLQCYLFWKWKLAVCLHAQLDIFF